MNRIIRNILYALLMIVSIIFALYGVRVNETFIESNKFEKLMFEAREFGNRNEPEQALNMYQGALSQAENDPTKSLAAQFGIAKMQLWLENYPEAEKVYNLILQRKLSKEEHEVALEGLVRALNAQNRSKEAIELIPSQFEYESAGMVLAAAQTFLAEGRIDQADSLLQTYNNLIKKLPHESHYEKQYHQLERKISAAHEDNKSFNQFITEAKHLLDVDEPNQALEFYGKALQATDNQINKRMARFGLARVEYLLENYSQSEELYRSILQEDLNEHEREVALEGLIRNLNEQERVEEAIRLIPSQFEYKNAGLVLAVAQSYFLSNKIEQADSLLKKYDALVKNLPQSSHYDKQYHQLEQQVKTQKDGRNFNQDLVKAKNFLEENEPGKAQEVYENALKESHDPEKIRVVHFGLAKVELWLEKYHLAEMLYRELLQESLTEQDFEVALEGLVKSLNAQERYKDAIKLIPTKFNYKNPGMVLAAAQAYLSIGMVEQAGLLLQTHHTMMSNLPKGSVLEKQYHHIEHQLATSLNHDEIFNRTIIEAKLFAETNKPIKALVAYQKALTLTDNPVNKRIARFGIAKMELWLEKYSLSEMLYRKILQDELSRQDREVALEGLIRSLNAQDHFKESLKLIPLNYKYTNPGMVIAVATTYLGSDMAGTAYFTVGKQKKLLQTIPKNSHLAKELNKLNEKIMKSLPLEIANPTLAMYVNKGKKAIENDKGAEAVHYYCMAKGFVQNCEQYQMVLFGLGTSYFLINNYSKASKVYKELLETKLATADYEVALNGYVRSVSAIDQTMKAYYSIPEGFNYTLPKMVVGAAQAALWSGWPQKSMDLLDCYSCLLKEIPAKSNLARQYEDVLWQSYTDTATDSFGYMHYHEVDSDHFNIFRDQLSYSHRFVEENKTSLLWTRNHYTQPALVPINGDIISLGQDGWCNDYIFYKAYISATNYPGWNPTLWDAKVIAKFNDYLSLSVRNDKEIVESIPAMYQHIALTQSELNVNLEPFYRIYLSGSAFTGTFSDHNVRRGTAGTISYLLVPEQGIYVDYFLRGYRNKHTSPYYFSPLKYREYLVSMRVVRRLGDLWRYYLSAGTGKEAIVSEPHQSTYKAALGVRGPLFRYLVVDAYFGLTNSAGINSAGSGDTGFARRFFGVNLQLPM